MMSGNPFGKKEPKELPEEVEEEENEEENEDEELDSNGKRPFHPRKPNTTVFVSNLPPTFTEGDLDKLFSWCKNIENKNLVKRFTPEKGHQDFARVAFASVEDFNKALKQDQTEISGQKINIVPNRRPQNNLRPQPKSLLVKSLDLNVTEEDLKEKFSSFGEITSCHVNEKEFNGARSAFVNFSTEEAAAAAIAKMNGKEWNGKILEIDHPKPKRQTLNKPRFEKAIMLFNLEENLTESDLNDMCSPFGTIVYKNVRKSETGTVSGKVQFEDPKEASAAVKALNGKNGMRVNFFKRKPQTRRFNNAGSDSFNRFTHPVVEQQEQAAPAPKAKISWMKK